MPQLVEYMEIIAINKIYRNTKNKRFKMRHASYAKPPDRKKNALKNFKKSLRALILVQS